MNKKIIWGIVAVLVLGGLYFTFSNKSQVAPVASNQSIKIGIMVPLTSPYSSVAEGVRNASLLAVADWQATHPNVKVETVIEDDAYDPAKGISAYNKLKNIDKVQGIVSISTPVVDALYKTYQKDGLPVINLGVQTEGATADNIFQIFPDAKGQVKPLADYLQNNTKYDSVVIIHSTNDPAYGQFYDEFVKLYTKPYKEVALNTKDDSKVVANKALATKSQAVIFILNPALGAVVTKEMKILDKKGMDYYYEGSLITGFDEYKKILGDTNILNGATTIKTVASDMTKFKVEYKAKYGTDPAIFAEVGYDSAMIMLNSFDKNQTNWVQNIQKTTFTGPSGKTTFDEKGIRIPTYEVIKVANGKVQ
ncbi:ABC transporter substrate-binding protein [Candidatus Gracilibacteria bacterium]|nr:ABC transporter substrate-binding protein [Candidatus Gracilibacteria bacterium]